MEYRNFKKRHQFISFLQDYNIVGLRFFSQRILPKLLIPRAKKTVVIETLYDFKLIVNPVLDNGVERSIYYTGTYEKGTLDFMKKYLKPGDTFVDVGANIGLMSLFASTCVASNGKVLAFEPNPETNRILNENIKINSFEKIEVFDSAIGSITEERKIYDQFDKNRGSASLLKPNSSSAGYDVSVNPLSSFISKDEIIKMIKIDVEGFELEVLNGASEILSGTTPPILIVECSEDRENSTDQVTVKMFDFISSINDYELYKMSGSKSRASSFIKIQSHREMPKHDNVFCFPKSTHKLD